MPPSQGGEKQGPWASFKVAGELGQARSPGLGEPVRPPDAPVRNPAGQIHHGAVPGDGIPENGSPAKMTSKADGGVCVDIFHTQTVIRLLAFALRSNDKPKEDIDLIPGVAGLTLRGKVKQLQEIIWSSAQLVVEAQSRRDRRAIGQRVIGQSHNPEKSKRRWPERFPRNQSIPTEHKRLLRQRHLLQNPDAREIPPPPELSQGVLQIGPFPGSQNS